MDNDRLSMLEGRDLLVVSQLLDDDYYRGRAKLSAEADTVSHYLKAGWLDNLSPRAEFDSAFLLPFYQASRRSGPPALTWLELSVLPGRRPPMNKTEADYVADRIRGSPFFDAQAYARGLPVELDPIMHYAVIGELLGWCPSAQLDPAFYLDRHFDVARLNLSPLDHYVEMGAREGRRAIPASTRLNFAPVPDHSRQTVLVIVHEASRTGAPVLGLNIVQRLCGTYNVVSVLMRGGPLERHFASTSAAMVGPLIGEEWHYADMRRVAERLVRVYAPLYAIANSVETSPIVPALGRLGVQIVALIHEFASYVRPLSKLNDVLDWAAHIVFPANVVAKAASRAFPAIDRRRGIHVLSQGRTDLPIGQFNAGNVQLPTRRILWCPCSGGADSRAFVVLGLGTVQLRKGVDLFIAAAAAAVRLAPECKFRFVWIGSGYDPIGDTAYSVYLSAQIIQSGLEGIVEMLDEVEDLEPAYANADLLFLASRLDPQPNVGIEAVARGLPTVCFEGACGTAEVLSADPATRPLVVPHLDAHAAAEVICRLARDPSELAAMRTATARAGAIAYDMNAYLRRVDGWGQAAGLMQRRDDLRTLAEAGIVDAELALTPNTIPPGLLAAERHVLQQWAVIGLSQDQDYNLEFRRPCPGFHPQAYASAHEACTRDGINPLAHWLRTGRPCGVWSHPVFSPLDAVPRAADTMVVALHAHIDQPATAEDLLMRLAVNQTRCDLFLSTCKEAQADQLRTRFSMYPGSVTIRVTPSWGRALGALLRSFSESIGNGPYDAVLHIHDDTALCTDTARAETQRQFLWENLIGPNFPMLDLAVTALSANTEIGLLIAEHPDLGCWGSYRPLAETLVDRMPSAPRLEDYFDFPRGGMFWARPAALRPLLELDLGWSDYPAGRPADTPMILGSMERLLPYAARSAGLYLAGLRAPWTTC